MYVSPRYRTAVRRMAPISKAAAELARTRMAARLRIANGTSNLLAGDPLFPVAVHESGHAVSGFLERSQIDSMAIFDAQRGRVRFSDASTVNCTILMSGMAAEIVILGFCERECARTDLRQARDILRSTCWDDRLIEARLDRELHRTIALLVTHRAALLALAAEIISKRNLSGGEVSRIINQVLAGVH
jgi:hypothetical protein